MRAASGIAARRPRAFAASAAAAIAIIAATPAVAQQCGAPGAGGAVTCTPAGNPYADGIVYRTPGGLSVTTTSGVFANGVLSVTSTGGAVTVSNAGTIANGATLTSSGPGGVTVTNSGAFALAGTAPAPVTGPAGLRAIATAGNVVISGTGSYASSVASAAALAVTASGTASLTLGNVTASGASDGVFVTATGGSTIVLNGASSSAGGVAVRINGGVTTITNNGTLTSGVVLSAGNDTFNNAGTFQALRDSDFGPGTDTFNNSGFFRVRPAAGPVNTVTLVGLETFNNSGTISELNNRTGDRLVIPGAFVGTGASTVQLDIGANFLGAADVLQTGIATGQTVVQLNTPIGSTFVPAFGVGPVVVRAATGTSAGAFVLSPAQRGSGVVAYTLAYDPAGATFTVVGVPTAPVYRVARVVEGQRTLWYGATDVWSAHVAASRDALAAGVAGGRLWGSFGGANHARRGGLGGTAFGLAQSFGGTYRQDAFSGTLGFDLLAPSGDGGLSFGVMGGYTDSKLRGVGTVDRVSYQVVTAGGYAGFSAGALFANVTGRYQHSWNDLRSGAGFGTSDADANLYGGAAEIGLRIGSGGFFVEPVASIDYVHVNQHDFTALGGRFHFDDQYGLRGKAGARIGSSMPLGAATLTIHAAGAAVHEFEGRDRLFVSTGGSFVSIGNDRIGTYAHGEAGFSVSGGGPVSGFVEGFGDYGDEYRGGGGRAGLSIRF